MPKKIKNPLKENPTQRVWGYFFISILAITIIGIAFLVAHYMAIQSPSFGSNAHVANTSKLDYMRPISESDRYFWKSSSKYTLVVYESLDCKFCRKLAEFVRLNEAVLKGKFNLVYRSAPLVNIEPLAAEKTLISECVFHYQGVEKMFAFNDSIYKDYKQFELDNEWVKMRAKEFLDTKDNLQSCLENPIVKSKVEEDIRGLLVDGVSFTPSIWVYYNGELVGRYASWLRGTIQAMLYLASFDQNADQFWSDALFEKIKTQWQ